MIYSSLKINMEFPVESGAYHIQIWGKPENFSQSETKMTGEQIVREQYNELKNYYSEHYGLNLATLKQVHGNRVVNALDSADKSLLESGLKSFCECDEADSFFNMEDKIALAIKTADCIPVLFFTPGGPFFGAIHSGWKGLELEILKSTLEYLPSIQSMQNVDINNFQFVVGPHIHVDNYETSEDVFNRFSLEFSNLISGFIKESESESDSKFGNDVLSKSSKRNLDLKKILKSQFLNSGIKSSQTIWLNQNTFGSNHFFSHRSGDIGRNFNVIFFKKYL